jgi:hypothetical protein
LICCWILCASYDLFLFIYMLASTSLLLVLSFWILTLLFRCFSFLLLFQEVLERPSGLQYPCDVTLDGWGGALPIWSQPRQDGHHSTESQKRLNWKAMHHAFCILHLLLRGHVKSGSTFRKRKTGRCWRWLKGWLKTGTLSMKLCLGFFLLLLELGRSWRSGCTGKTLAELLWSIVFSQGIGYSVCQQNI